MGAPQKYRTRTEQTVAIIDEIFADPAAVIAELVRRGHLARLTADTYRAES